MGEALAYYIQKDSEWLKAICAATSGLSDAVKMAQGDPKKYICEAAPVTLINIRKMTEWKNYDKMRWIGALVPETYVWVTYDSKIKEIKDLAGKNVFIGREGGFLTPDQKMILQEAGVLDKVKLSNGGWGSGANALRDGLVDASVMLIDHIWPATFLKGAYITELQTKKPVYYINMDPKVLRAGSTPKPGELWPNHGTLAIRIFPGALDANTQTTELWATGMPVMLAADEQMDADIVYEVTRVLNKRAGSFGVWHQMGQNLTSEFIPTYLFNETLVHPGALKYYKDSKIKLRNLLELLP